MSEESKLKAGPNASELEWAFEAAVEGLDVNGQESAQDLNDLQDSDEDEIKNEVAGDEVEIVKDDATVAATSNGGDGSYKDDEMSE